MEKNKISIQNKLVNTFRIAIGLLIAGVGIGFMFNAGQGSTPSATIVEGISMFFKLNYGISGIIANIFFLIILFFLDRSLINVGTVLATFCLGYFIDFGVLILSPLNILSMSLILRILMAFIGCVITAIGLGYYIGVDFGSGAMDGMSLILHRKLNIPFIYCRWGMDALLMLIGIILGASWGIGTVISIILTGPIMSSVISKMKK